MTLYHMLYVVLYLLIGYAFMLYAVKAMLRSETFEENSPRVLFLVRSVITLVWPVFVFAVIWGIVDYFRDAKKSKS